MSCRPETRAVRGKRGLKATAAAPDLVRIHLLGELAHAALVFFHLFLASLHLFAQLDQGRLEVGVLLALILHALHGTSDTSEYTRLSGL